MNLRTELALSLSAHDAPLPSLYFRPADEARLVACLSGLLSQGQSLALSCSNEAALGHYADILVDQLRRMASCPVEIYFPASTQAMVSRFDELLDRLTMQEALNETADALPQRIWLVHDAAALADHELQLLSRLVSNFPGAGVRVVLVFGPGLKARRGFESLGRRFMRWDIELPSPEQAQAMLGRARSDGSEPFVAELLRHVQPQPARPVPREPALAAPRRVEPVASLSSSPLPRLSPAPATVAASAHPTPPGRPSRAAWRGVLAGGVLLLLLGLAWLSQRPMSLSMPWLEPSPAGQKLRSQAPLIPTAPSLPTEQRT